MFWYYKQEYNSSICKKIIPMHSFVQDESPVTYIPLHTDQLCMYHLMKIYFYIPYPHFNISFKKIHISMFHLMKIYFYIPYPHFNISLKKIPISMYRFY